MGVQVLVVGITSIATLLLIFWEMKGLRVEGLQVIETLQKIEDRCDKTGNKASMIERRMEALVGSQDDIQRHIHQAIRAYDKNLGEPEVLKEWIVREKCLWRAARLRWREDASEEAWRGLIQATMKDIKEELQYEEESLKDLKEASVEVQTEAKQTLEQGKHALQVFEAMWNKGTFEDTAA